MQLIISSSLTLCNASPQNVCVLPAHAGNAQVGSAAAAAAMMAAAAAGHSPPLLRVVTKHCRQMSALSTLLDAEQYPGRCQPLHFPFVIPSSQLLLTFLVFLRVCALPYQVGLIMPVLSIITCLCYQTLTCSSIPSLPYQVGVITLASVNHYLPMLSNTHSFIPSFPFWPLQEPGSAIDGFSHNLHLPMLSNTHSSIPFPSPYLCSLSASFNAEVALVANGGSEKHQLSNTH
jgi:hypothetical protein